MKFTVNRTRSPTRIAYVLIRTSDDVTAAGPVLATATLAIAAVGANFEFGTDFPITFIVVNTNGVPNPRPTGDLEIFRSDDDGLTWDLVATEPLVDNENPFVTDSPGGYVYYEEPDDLVPGTYDYYAEYAGEPAAAAPTASFGPSTSGGVNGGNGITVEYGSTTTATPASPTYAPGEIVVVDVEVVSNPTGGPVQEGEVQLYKDGVLIQTLPLDNGTAQFQDGGEFSGTLEYYAVFVPSTFAQFPSTSPTTTVEILGLGAQLGTETFASVVDSPLLYGIDPQVELEVANSSGVAAPAPSGDVTIRRSADLGETWADVAVLPLTIDPYDESIRPSGRATPSSPPPGSCPCRWCCSSSPRCEACTDAP